MGMPAAMDAVGEMQPRLIRGIIAVPENMSAVREDNAALAGGHGRHGSIRLRRFHPQIKHTVKIKLRIPGGFPGWIVEADSCFGNDVAHVNIIAVAHRHFNPIRFAVFDAEVDHFRQPFIISKRQLDAVAVGQNLHFQKILRDLVVIHRRLFPMHAVRIHLPLQLQIQPAQRFPAHFLTEWMFRHQQGCRKQAVVFQHAPVGNDLRAVPDFGDELFLLED